MVVERLNLVFGEERLDSFVSDLHFLQACTVDSESCINNRLGSAFLPVLAENTCTGIFKIDFAVLIGSTPLPGVD